MALVFTEKELLSSGQLYLTPSGTSPLFSVAEILLELTEGSLLDQNIARDIPFASTVSAVFFRSIPGEPNAVTWGIGDWVVTIWCHRNQFKIKWQKFSVYRLNTSNAIVGSAVVVKSNIDQRMATDNTQFTATVTQTVISTGAASDRIYIVCEFENTHFSKDKPLNIANDGGIGFPFNKVVTPIEVGVSGQEVNLTSTPNTIFNALQPTVSVPLVAEPIAAIIAMEALQPIVSKSETVLPDDANITFAVLQPIVSKSETVLPSFAKIRLRAFEPVVIHDQTVSPNKTTIVFRAFEPSVTSDESVVPDHVTMVFKAFEPTVEAKQEAFPNKATMVFRAFEPVVTIPGPDAIVGPANIRFKALQPQVINNAPAIPTTARIVFTAFEPEVTGGPLAFFVYDGNRHALVGGEV